MRGLHRRLDVVPARQMSGRNQLGDISVSMRFPCRVTDRQGQDSTGPVYTELSTQSTESPDNRLPNPARRIPLGPSDRAGYRQPLHRVTPGGQSVPPRCRVRRPARYVYAVGSNPEAARLAGVRVAVVTTAVYVISGVLAAVGGVLLTSRLGAGVPTGGTGFELQAIAACVIGGASLSGARGGAIGAACGALIIGVLNNGGNLLAINAFYLEIAIGALVLGGRGYSTMNTRKSARASDWRAADVRAGRALAARAATRPAVLGFAPG